MNIFIDSSILIEFEKQTRTELFLALYNSKHNLYINAIVVSEYIYKLIGIIAQKSPLSVCESKKIKETLDKHDTMDFLTAFEYLSVPEEAVPLSIDLMKKHNLLPNDALILASHDSDFALACQNEGVLLLDDNSDISALIQGS